MKINIKHTIFLRNGLHLILVFILSITAENVVYGHVDKSKILDADNSRKLSKTASKSNYLTNNGNILTETNNQTDYQYKVVDDQTVPLAELSGLTYDADEKKLIAVGDAEQILEIFFNEFGETFLLKNDEHPTCQTTADRFRDTEGIFHIEGDQYAIVEERKARVSLIDIASGNNCIDVPTNQSITLTYNDVPPNDDVPSNDNDGIEGLTYDNQANKFYVIKQKDASSLFSFTAPSGFNGNVPLTLIKRLNNIVPGLTIESVHGIHYDANTDHLLIIGTIERLENSDGDNRRLIIETTTTGDYINHLDLELDLPNLFPYQSTNGVEGITMVGDKIVLVGEIDNSNFSKMYALSKEFTCGLKPLSRIIDVQRHDCGGSQGLEFTFNNVNPANTYETYYTTDLISGNWNRASGEVQISGSTATWNDCDEPDRGFTIYRIHETCDTDSDGLPDAFEIFATDTSPYEEDSDANGIPDSVEDSDCDGFTNADEYTTPFMGATSYCDNDCDNSIVIAGDPIQELYSANAFVSTSGYVTVDNVNTFRAGRTVELNPGFLAETGSVFIGEIAPCVSLDDEPVVEAKIPTTGTGDILVYPNPIKSDEHLNIEFDIDVDKDDATLTIHNINGQVVHQETISVQKGENNRNIFLKNYISGMYMIRIQVGTHTLNNKLIIK